MKSFVKENFDKLLLSGIVIYMVHVVVILSMWTVDPSTVSWARELTSGAMGALLGLITGIRVGQKIEQDKQREDRDGRA